MKWVNCDVGECLIPDPDQQLMPFIDSANIACGGHVGNKASMEKTITLAIKHNVKIAAHPSYCDKKHFGRVSLQIDAALLFKQLAEQVQALSDIAALHDKTLSYIKPHGALYHDMMRDEAVAEVICQLSLAFGSLPILIQAGLDDAAILTLAKQKQIPIYKEAFADRSYDGVQLRPRSEANALLTDVEAIIEQYQQFQQAPPFDCDTLCFHSDNPASIEALTRLYLA